MKKLDLVLRLTLSAMLMVCFAGKSFADTADESQTLDVDIPAVVTPVFVAATTTITPTQADFPISRADTAIDTDITRNLIVVGDGAVGTSTSYVLTNSETDATDLSYEISATAGVGTTTAVITKPADKGVLTLTNAAADSVVLFMVDNTTKLAVPTLGGINFATLTEGKLTIPAESTVDFTGIEAAVDMALDLDENTLTYAGDPPHNYAFTITLTAIGL